MSWDQCLAQSLTIYRKYLIGMLYQALYYTCGQLNLTVESKWANIVNDLFSEHDLS
jgi:hypothetical protein